MDYFSSGGSADTHSLNLGSGVICVITCPFCIAGPGVPVIYCRSFSSVCIAGAGRCVSVFDPLLCSWLSHCHSLLSPHSNS